MKKGFTLTELLGVITLLGIIAMISVPLVINQVKRSKESISESTEQLIFNAVELYMKDDPDNHKMTVGDVYCTQLNTLVNENLLYEPIQDVETGQAISLEKVVKTEVTEEGKQHEIVGANSCTPKVSEPLYVQSVTGVPFRWTNQDVTLTVTSSEEASEYCFNDVCQPSNTYVVKENGIIGISVKDKEGNRGPTKRVKITKIDKDAPEFTLSVQAGVLDVTVTTSAITDSSGILSYAYYYKLSSNPDSSYQRVYEGLNTNYTITNLDMATSYDIKVVVTDNAGNKKEQMTTAGTQCFVAGTKVLTESGLRNIEDIQVGDYVYALNLDTNEKELKQVTDIFVGKTNELYDVTIDGKVVSATPKHQFYVVDKGWIRAHDLEVGDMLVAKDQTNLVIETIVHRKLTELENVYNLTVDGLHTYLITENEILVHNAASRAPA